MCDLIDLNSPDRKGSLSSRLASPLIPAPIDAACSNYNSRTTDPRSLVVGKRDSLENNPFDMVLHKTTEYIQKKDDPFEVTLEKALKLKSKKNMLLRTGSFDLPKNCDLKHKIDVEKLNKTLDEGFINDEINQNNTSTNKMSNDNIVIHVDNTNAPTDIIKSKNVILDTEVQAADLSILNQSVMNDILFETDIEPSEDKTKPISQSKLLTDMDKDRVNTEKIVFVKTNLEVPKLRRSVTQGEIFSPKKSQYLNPLSIESLCIDSDSGSNISSNSLNILNEGFIRSRYSVNSVCSSISNISSIHRINSASSTNNSSLIVSNGTINRTFLESCSSEQSECTRFSENIDLNKEINPFLSVTRKSTNSLANALTRPSMSDLTDRYDKLKAKTSVSMISESLANNENMLTCSLSNTRKECITVIEGNEKLENNKLVDVDIFTPENNYTTEQGTSSISDTSSDSVFIETNKINKSILQEAKLLARTFEELALKTNSGSSIDDLITSNPLWASELLPAFEDEVSIENLIELPTSPDGSDAHSKDVMVEKCNDNNLNMEKQKEYSNQITGKIKELEMELVEPIHAEKRYTAATLLLDLKKLIETENNPEANKLLENLEKVLGVNCENNTELLATCLDVPNNLERNAQKLGNTLEITKNVAENNMEHSHENNVSNDSVDAVNFNGSTSDKCTSKRKYLEYKDTYNKSQSEAVELEVDTNKIKKEETNTHNVKEQCQENSPRNGENNNTLHEKAVIELLTNIGKLLSGQTDEHSTLDILKNLGNILNFASNRANSDGRNSSSYIEIQQTPKKSKIESENKTRPSMLSKSISRLSLDLESKTQPPCKNVVRRSMSVSQTLPLKNGSTLISFSKNTSQLKEVTKRFPSDPGFVSPTVNKKPVISNRKNVVQNGAETNPVATFEVPREKTSAISTAKNKFKKKLTRDIVNKKGPMKAMLPIGNMQKREAISNKIPMAIDGVTPPKSKKLISSTPNSTVNGLVHKKSRSSKPVASSTPDAQSSKTRKIPTQIIPSPKKRNFSCDISPVTTRVTINSSGTAKSPRRNSKLQSPKRTTPKRRPMESGIPKSNTPPVSKRLNSSFDVNQCERTYESPQRSLYKTSNSQKNSPATMKVNENNVQRSPFRDNNKLNYKVKPINLISKLRRHSVGTIATEKENYV